MPVNIIVNQIPIAYPSPGDEPGWGEAGTQFAVEVAEVLTSLVNANDILETTFSVQNNVTTFTNVAGLSFSTGQVRSAEIIYSIYRTSTLNPSGVVESGSMNIVYDNNAASGDKWKFAIGNVAGPGAGVTFNILDSGQIQYKSTDIGAAGYSGEMRFRAKTVLSI